jgi:hypothetical protein
MPHEPTISSIKFRHLPLDREKEQIRLLKVERSRENFWDRPLCTLQTFDLSSTPKYIALSYEWGDEDAAKQTTRVNDRDFEIRLNLFNFFCYFREQPTNSEHAYLWIDQVCIDQTSMDEKSHQLGLMSEIYSKAWLVIAWLGCGDKMRQATWDLKQQTLQRDAALSTLLNNSYFDRLWIIQEMLLARELRIMCAEFLLSPYELLEHASKLNYDLTTNSAYKPSAWLLWDSLYGRGQRTLLQCIERYSRNMCFEPRDKVYGLLGLVHEHERLQVDYNKSVWQVFLETLDIIEGNCRHVLMGSHPVQDVLERSNSLKSAALILADGMSIQTSVNEPMWTLADSDRPQPVGCEDSVHLRFGRYWYRPKHLRWSCETRSIGYFSE